MCMENTWVFPLPAEISHVGLNVRRIWGVKTRQSTNLQYIENMRAKLLSHIENEGKVNMILTDFQDRELNINMLSGQ